jgi:hypothetical protein
MTGQPGLCGDSTVFKRMMVHKDPDDFFDPGKEDIFVGSLIVYLS